MQNSNIEQTNNSQAIVESCIQKNGELDDQPENLKEPPPQARGPM